MKKIAASFASSDGCMPKPPTPNQRRVPLIGGPNSTATSVRPTTPNSAQMSVVAVGAVVDAHHDDSTSEAERRPRHLLEEEEIRLLEALQRHDAEAL